ncbi:E3 ubiquitin-protein ligase WAV3-like [Triticum dicoccoides]|uniref:E3 ubiquitin-protein ligase WAV3-like n=1 Tax=Triticum dicoccoides TaxID=85692 RepID=UPI001891DE9B|nr:E3 ubiquitin-protein ligase WAV3-like [Triticum dicoccoides]
MSITTHCEYPAIAKDASRDGFAVLVHAKAPALAPAAAKAARAPLDLVMVLDVSGSMGGRKLALLKQAVGFVVDKLGPHDRLSLVSFSCDARRLTRLTRMSDAGRASTERTVESLAAGGGTNIKEGLREAAKVIDGRRYRNAVTGVILLSDDQDNYTLSSRSFYWVAVSPRIVDIEQELVPPSLIRTGDGSSPPIHTFGFGTDHDSAAMHTIAEATGGTFAFIGNEAVIQDSFAQCIGGLLSVAAQEARVAVECVSPGVRVRSIKSGRYKSRVDANGRTAAVEVGELYADEERRFLLFVDVPKAGATDDVASLMKVSCTYRDVATGQSVDVAGEEVAVKRPVEAPEAEPDVEVERERLRVQAAEDIAAAQAAAERGEHAEASEMLSRRRMALRQSPLGASGDAGCAELAAELGELSERVGDRREYDLSGRASLLCGMSAHSQQRTSVKVGRARYATPAMRKMVDLSVKTREQQRQQQQAQAQPSPPSRTTMPPPPPPSTAKPALAKNLVRRYHRFLRLK